MSKVFYRKQFSDYLGEQRAIDDIVSFYEPNPITPSPTPTPSVTPTLTPTNTPTPSITATVTPTMTSTNTATPTPTITPTNTVTPTRTLTPTPTITPTKTSSPTPTPTVTPSSTPAPSGTTEANTYLSAVVSAGGSGVTSTVSAATVTLFTSLVSNGLYSKIIAMYPLLGQNAAGCKFNAVNPLNTDAAYRITYAGGMTFSSDGQTSNGSNGIGTTYINQTVAPSVRLFGTYSLTTDTTLGTDIINASGNAYIATAYPGGSPKRTIFNFNGGASAQINPSDGIGFFVGQFSASSTTMLLYKNGVLSNTTAGGTVNYGTANTLFPNATNNTTAFGIFTTELTSAQVATLSTIIETFVTAIGRKQYKLINSYPGAVGAWSLRLLNNTYAGSAIRVRRSSDNTELNIGFDGNGDLDTTTLSTFVGPNSGFVTTWYDQSGLGRNLAQATAANQPRIVNAGTIDRKGTQNKPSIKFDGTNDYLFISTAITSSNISTFIVAGDAANNNSAPFTLYPATGLDYNSLDSALLETGGPSDWLTWMNNFSNGTNMWSISQTGTGSTPYQLVNAMKQPTGAQLLTSGSTRASVTKALANGSHAGIQMGARVSPAFTPPYFDGYEQEVILYLIDQTGNLTSINSNINTYYGVY